MSRFSRRRSQSPSANPQSSSRHHFRRRSPSPIAKAQDARARPISQTDLPFQAQVLKKGDLERFEPMFGLYLDIQKQLVLDELDEKELKGRWKRFVGRWNRGELAEGWYDPQTLVKARSSANDPIRSPRPSIPTQASHDNITEDDDDDGYGPALPSKSDQSLGRARPPKHSGPSIPSLQDLEYQKELDAEQSLHDREALREARKADRNTQKERLEEIAPRAAPGTKDRQLERKADLRVANNAFAASKTDPVAEVPETDLMGDEEGGFAGYKKRKGEEERKRNDREIRRDEILRARKAEREERVQAYKEKEERTMEGL
ncbi:MAG: hypothetical protein Q9169_007457, partial [Polycauliona sp. 2 TL-2023]